MRGEIDYGVCQSSHLQLGKARSGNTYPSKSRGNTTTLRGWFYSNSLASAQVSPLFQTSPSDSSLMPFPTFYIHLTSECYTQLNYGGKQHDY